MVKTIQPDEYPSSARSTPTQKKSPSQNNDSELGTNQIIYNSASSQHANHSVDAKMVAQHREIERLVESRQRLHTIKDQIASLHQSMTTPPPPIPSKNDLRNQTQTYEDKLNDSKNIRPSYRFNYQRSPSQDDNESELYRFQGESEDGEETDDDTGSHIQINQQTQQLIKQSVSRTRILSVIKYLIEYYFRICMHPILSLVNSQMN